MQANAPLATAPPHTQEVDVLAQEVEIGIVDPAGYLLKRQIIGRGEQGRHARDRRDLGRDREVGTLVQVETSLVPHARRSRDHYRP